ncbi:uncharacterized protein DEA37_0014228 [Paragonimus westermani]|uniref:UPAR/Ly6 domain-containing protein n=1 Tax=Paragonimus westermani TaxID=34504 RepID=A0A5J4NSW5_9TREM|nr:uncharacterized protein DEA37_0014228 [Paragonimus westermani]
MFSRISVLAFLALVATSYITAVQSVKCYVCSDCGNTLNNISWKDNCNACMSITENGTITKSCVEDCSYTAYLSAGFDRICCRTDYCNGTDRLIPTFVLWSLFVAYTLFC